MAGEVGDGEHFIAQRRDEQQIHPGKDACHFLGHAAAQAVGLDEVHGGKKTGLAKEVGPRIGNLYLKFLQAATEGEILERRDKLLFGSDCLHKGMGGPECWAKQTLDALRRLAPSTSVLRKILYENGRRLLRSS